MKNTLHVFGDSFTESTKSLFTAGPHAKNSTRLLYAKKYHNVDFYENWSTIMAKELNFNEKNYASTGGKNFEILGQGNSNESIICNLNEYCHTFKPNDIVIIGFTDISRFQWPNNNSPGANSILPNQPLSNTEFSVEEQRMLRILSIKRHGHPFFKEQLEQQMKVFEVLSEYIGFHLYYWSWANDNTKYKNNQRISSKKWIIPTMEFDDYINLISKYGGSTITQETSGEIQDDHMNKKSQSIHSKIFLEHIRDDIKSKKI